jgi:CDP-glycerol glycerophosphotransferase
MRLRRSSAPGPNPSVDELAEQVRAASAALPQDPRLIVFESMAGRQYSDSPRAIYEALVRLDVTLKPVWSVRKGAVGFPDGVRTVTRRTPEWVEAMATAAVWVDNQGFARWLPKPDRVHYLQTWHGTPLKRMGWQDPALTDIDSEGARDLQAVYDRWDAITAPSEYFVETIVHAFRSRAEVLRVGMPRNDVLVRPLASAERAARLGTLGLAAEVPTMLFAPTRTADPEVSRGRWDAAAAVARTGVQVMYRGHYSDERVDDGQHAPGLIDVSEAGDMADLLVVADLLITDYSSSMFDFALTDRPIVLFQPDQSSYLSGRGANFDILTFSPGPIATSKARLGELVESVDDWSSDWGARRQEYRDRFGLYEHGDAAERVVREHLLPRLGGSG